MKNFSLLTALLLSASIHSFAYAQDIDFAADYVRYEEDGQLVYVEGNVELDTDYGYFYVDKLLYDLENEVIYIDGELRGVAYSGERVITRFTELDLQKQNNILREAKFWLTDKMQISTTYAVNNEDYDYGENIVSSRCTVCALNPTPIWQVRAQQVYRDTPNQKIYFKNAFFDLYGIPIGWTPYLRVPAPEAIRQSGFLAPRFVVTDTSLKGVKLPYYQVINDHTDLLITNYFTTSNIQIFEPRLRHEFKGGSYLGIGSWALNDGDGERGRYYLQHNLKLKLPYDFRINAKYQQTSDYDYIPDIDYTNLQANELRLERFKNNNYFTTTFRDYNPTSIRASKKLNFPTVKPQIRLGYQTQFWDDLHFSSDLDVLSIDNDTGYDVDRITGKVDIAQTSALEPGILINSNTGAIFQLYDVTENEDDDLNGTATRLTPNASLDISLPLARFTDRASYTLTPEMFLSWSENHENGVTIPNNDSLFAEHDYVTLFSENRYAGYDRYEEGLRASFGLRYGVNSFEQERFEMGLGGVWRAQPIEMDASQTKENFTDWVGFASYEFSDEFSLYSRFAFDQNFEFSRSEVSLNYEQNKSKFNIDWVRIAPEPELGFDTIRSEILFDGEWNFHPNWQVNYDTRIDLIERETFDAGLTFIYGNECIEIEAAVDWAFPRSTGLNQETKYSLGVDLIGLTANATDKWGKKKCRY